MRPIIGPWAAPVFVSVLFFTSCSGDKTVHAGKPADTAVPVTVGFVVQKAMPVELRAIGSVEAYSTVIVKTQIQGELMRVFFTEGQDVRKGDPLFELDPRPYEEAVRAAEAALARDIAQQKQAEANLARDIAQAEYARKQAGATAGWPPRA